MVIFIVGSAIMKCTIPEISWHNREPVLSVAIHPQVNGDRYKLATAGGDSHIVIWQLEILDSGAVKQELLSELTRHQRTVNVVRWSLDGKYLASADDDANIIIWQLKVDDVPLLDDHSQGNEVWICHKILRGHKEDIYDLCWSPDGSKLLSGSIDNTAIIWDLARGKYDCILTEHKGFVQGVAWDPKGSYLATLSTDRTLRIFDSGGKQVKAVMKGTLPVPPDHHLHEKEVKYFHDDTFKSFFRRLDFSPDGNLLLVPSGMVETEECKKPLYTTNMFAVGSWSQPVGVLPNPRQCSTVVRCCPVLFELREDGPDPIISLPYRMVVAVGTDRDIVLYDTQQMAPFARFSDVHYTRLTDLAWSTDAKLLVASSTDGFCSLVTFLPEEMGLHYYLKKDSETEDAEMQVDVEEQQQQRDIQSEEQVKKKEADVATISGKKRSTFLKEWAMNATPKKNKLGTKDGMESNEKSNEKATEVIDITGDDECCENGNNMMGENNVKAEEDDKGERVRLPATSTTKCNDDTSHGQGQRSDGVVDVKESAENMTVKKRITPVLIAPSNRDPKKRRIAPILVAGVKRPSEDKRESKRITPIPVGVIPKKRITPIPVNNTSNENDVKARPAAVRRPSKEKPLQNTTNTDSCNDVRLMEIRKSGEKEQEIVLPGHKEENFNQKAEEIKLADNPEESKLVEEQVAIPDQAEAKECPSQEITVCKSLSPNDTREPVLLNQSSSVNKDNTQSPARLSNTNSVPSKSSSAKSRQKQKEKRSTPKHTTSLLKFLKPSPKQSSSEKMKPSSKANLFGKPSEDSECILIEDEARDAWKCDKSNSGVDAIISDSQKMAAVTSAEDDITEDFCLQIEDSTQGQGQCTAGKSTRDSNKRELDNQEVSVSVDSQNEEEAVKQSEVIVTEQIANAV